MIDLDKLEEEYEEVADDKAELFDFYHNNWREVVSELRRFQDREKYREQVAADHLSSNYRGSWE